MKNKMSDLMNHLYAEIERLSDESLSGDALKDELKRANGIKEMSNCITSNLNAMLRAEELKASAMDDFHMPTMIDG